MNRYLIAIALFLGVYTGAFAQGGRTTTSSSNDKPGPTIHVFDAKGEVKLPDVRVMIVMGKDTVRLKTDRNGQVNYGGAIRTEKFAIIVSHPGYISQREELRSPPPHVVRRSNHYFYLKTKKETDSANQQ